MSYIGVLINYVFILAAGEGVMAWDVNLFTMSSGIPIKYYVVLYIQIT